MIFGEENFIDTCNCWRESVLVQRTRRQYFLIKIMNIVIAMPGTRSRSLESQLLPTLREARSPDTKTGYILTRRFGVWMSGELSRRCKSLRANVLIPGLPVPGGMVFEP